jgi:hypothetical protein
MPPFVGARHMLHICMQRHRQRVLLLAQRDYVPLMPGPSQGLVEPIVRVVRLSRGQIERYSMNLLDKHNSNAFKIHLFSIQ